MQPAPILNQFPGRLRRETEIATCQTTRVNRKDRTICVKFVHKQKICATVVSPGRQLYSSTNECHCILQKELRDEHERRTVDELSKQREYYKLQNPLGRFNLVSPFLFFIFATDLQVFSV